nr:U3 snoRNP-associated protein-like EMB2271 [Tanacetum cinerariifolium]
KGVKPLFELPLVGYVNSLAFAKSGKFLVAGVGKEPRLGRWGSLPTARHGVALHPLHLS